MTFETAQICNIGGRMKNDDTVMIQQNNHGVRAYVGDGLGSYAGGKQASETAGKVLVELHGDLFSENVLKEAAEQANDAVRELQKNTEGTMKTTVVFLNVDNDSARWMHIGDSRLYHFVDGTLVHQTVDHSVSQMAVMMGEITTHEIRFHEDRNRVLRAVGGENAKPEISPVADISRGKHAFLLCTDGFWEYVYEPEMEKTLRQSSGPQDWLNRMEQILLTRITGNNDNYSAAAVMADSGLKSVASGIEKGWIKKVWNLLRRDT